MGDASPVRLQLFGAPTAAVGDTSIALPFERRTQLVVLLALRRQWVPRAEVAAMLWPEQENKLAYANLRKTLFRLPSLPWPVHLETQGASLRLRLATDVAEFESALQERRTADALAAYGGDLLAGFDDGESEAWTRWVAFERDRLRAAWRGAVLAELAQPAETPLEPARAIALSARLLDADPHDEAALRHHIDALVRDGQSGAARAAWRTFVDRLSADLGLEPSAQLRALHDSVGAPPKAGAPSAPPVAAGDDGFVGRAVDLHRIADLLGRDECRLLCLVGPGGVGKTRLARRVMRDLATRHADGALFIALEDVDTPARFGLRLAQEAGVASGGGDDDAMARAVEAWRTRHLLLVLDNFEQLADHAQLLDELLQACPRMKILATSRLRLAVAGAWSMPVEGLPWPEPEDSDRAESFDAVRLFVKAAQRVDPAFAAAAESAGIVEICRLVEGLPLALEMAAAWVRVLSCRTIADELRQGSELLRAADSSRPQRHSSIEAVFEHSWRRLTVVEREALSRLSVFHGGFSVNAARVVAGASLPVLGALGDKSLITKDGDRMRLHPLVQQLAAMRLDEGAARASTQAAHAAYFHHSLLQLGPATERGQREALHTIDTEFENCRRAWQFFIAEAQPEPLMQSVPTLIDYFEHRARFEAGLVLLREAIESPLAAADARLRALLVSEAALMQMRLGRYTEARDTAAQALEAARAANDEQAHYRAFSVLGGCALSTGRPGDARVAYRRALALAEERAQPRDIASSLDNLALCEKRLGGYDEALHLSLEALAQHRRHGDDARLAVCLTNLGSMFAFMDDIESARAHLREALELSERHGLVSTRAFVLANLTELALKGTDFAAAQEHAERALEVAEGGGLRALAGWLKAQLSRLAAKRGEHGRARELLSGSAELALSLGAQSVKAAVLLALAELLEAQAEAGAARRVLAFGADERSLSAPDRDELRAQWARRGSPAVSEAPWPGLTLDALLQRIVVERDPALASIVGALRAPIGSSRA